MVRTSFIIALLLAIAPMSLGCTGGKAGKVWVHPQIQEYKAVRIQVFPFEDRVRSKRPLISEDSELITRAIVAALDEAGLTLLPRSALDALVEQKGLNMTEVSEEQGLELARALGADAVVYGLLTSFSKGDCEDGGTAVGFVLKGVTTDGWTDLFRGGIERRSTKDPECCSSEALATKAATDMVAKLVEGGIGPRNEL